MNRTIVIAALVLTLAASAANPEAALPQPPPGASSQMPPAALPALVPLPALVEPGSGEGFAVTGATVIEAPADPAVQRTARMIGEWIRRASGRTLTASPAAGTDPAAVTTIALAIDSSASTGAEGYDLTIGAQRVVLKAASPAGLFYAAQTLRQLL